MVDITSTINVTRKLWLCGLEIVQWWTLVAAAMNFRVS